MALTYKQLAANFEAAMPNLQPLAGEGFEEMFVQCNYVLTLLQTKAAREHEFIPPQDGAMG
jgi:hypothetical protein